MDLGVLLPSLIPSLQSVTSLFSFDSVFLRFFSDQICSFRYTCWCLTSLTWPLLENFSPEKLSAASFYQTALSFVTDAMVT